jgi:YesN/AraC family two-component response regulator
MNLAYNLTDTVMIPGLIIAYPVTIWILGTAAAHSSIILIAANRVAMLLACAYAVIALLALLKNRRKMLTDAPELQIVVNRKYALTAPEKKNDKIGRFLNDEKLTHFNFVINQFLIHKKPFLQQKYSLRDLSVDVDIPVNYLSAFINRYHKMNYGDFMNRYRVSHSREMILAGEWKSKTLEAIASESGFNNRNTFTAAFKKETGESPSEFLRETKKNHQDNRSTSNKAQRVLV